MKKRDVMRILKKHSKELEEEFDVASISLFGSVARDEASSDSDVDLLVEFSKPVGLFQFIGLKQRLEELLGCKVDLGTNRSLKTRIKDHVLQEAIRVA
jgi:predicted nucleotidyltransferase